VSLPMQPIGNELNTKEKKKIIALLFPWGFFSGCCCCCCIWRQPVAMMMSFRWKTFFPFFFFLRFISLAYVRAWEIEGHLHFINWVGHWFLEERKVSKKSQREKGTKRKKKRIDPSSSLGELLNPCSLSWSWLFFLIYRAIRRVSILLFLSFFLTW
jgi:hypothetical protein